MRTTVLPALVVLTLGLVVSGCGGGSTDAVAPSTGAAFAAESAPTIGDAARRATTGAASLQLTGTLTNQGQSEQLALRLDDHGTCRGSLSIGDRGSAQILGTGGTYWFKPDAAFWHSYAGAKADQVIALVGDKWVVNPDLADLCDLDGFFGGAGSSSTAEVGGTESVDGQETVELTTTDPRSTTVTDVLTSDPHYVVRLTRTGAAPGSFTLSDFGATLDVQAPPAADQIDLGAAGG